uniref:Uncharacterized protein n=1 Tax=Romanomermis culicivorax TaxID=13658 RepID=A0A915KXB7_ROMCU
MFRNQVVVDRANRPKPSVRNPKKTKQQLEEEEDDEQYVLIDEMEHRTQMFIMLTVSPTDSSILYYFWLSTIKEG